MCERRIALNGRSPNGTDQAANDVATGRLGGWTAPSGRATLAALPLTSTNVSEGNSEKEVSVVPVEERPFSQLTEQEMGKLDPAVAYRPGTSTGFETIDSLLDNEGHPVPGSGETFRSRWMGVGTAVFQYGDEVSPVVHGGMFAALGESRMLVGWHDGLQFMRSDAGDLQETGAQIAFTWNYDSMSQIFILGRKRKFGRFEAKKLRVVGGRQGLAQMGVEAVFLADEQWRVANADAAPCDFEGFATAIAKAATQEAHGALRWQEGPSPFEAGEYALMIEI
jgi:hypothetical protein